MKILSIFPNYILWHYTKAISCIFYIIFHFTIHIIHFFSIPILLKTLFSPWRKLSENYSKRFDLVEILSSFTVNTTMRLFGAMFRITIIIMGLLLTLSFLILGLIFLIYWIVIPLLLIFLIVFGFNFLFIL